MKKVDKQLQDIEKQIKNNKVNKSTIRDLAEKAGLVTIYDSAYKLLSGTIHVNAHDLEQYLEINESGEVKKMLWGPDVQEIDFVLLTAAESMLSVLRAVSSLFKLPYDESLQAILEKHASLCKEFNEQCE